MSQDLGIAGVRALPLRRQLDDRGWFMEIFRENAMAARFVQANHSHSRAGVLRGLHYHRRQADAWYVVRGRAQVGLADLRRPRQPIVATVELSPEEPAVLFLPPGVAHGFLALTDVDLLYWVTEYYDNTDEFGVAWNDPSLAVPWKKTDPVLSERDATAPGVDWEEVSRVLAEVRES
jgi:dTDP-4-dehydrorhamnose 3,5-epimerase